MSTTAALPTLTGHRLKTRKRDQKAAYNAEGFRDAFIESLEAGSKDLLETIIEEGKELDYKTYGVTFVDIMLAGNIVEPNGHIPKEHSYDGCLFNMTTDAEIDELVNILDKVMRRFKYLLKTFENHIMHLLKFITIFDSKKVELLARFIATCFSNCTILPLKALESLLADHLTKDSTSIDFLTQVFTHWTNKFPGDFSSIGKQLNKSGINSRILDFFPENSRDVKGFEDHFTKAGLLSVVTYYQSKRLGNCKAELENELLDAFEQDPTIYKRKDEIISIIDKKAKENNIPESHLFAIVFTTVMDSCKWSKNIDMLEKQVYNHIKQSAELFKYYTTKEQSKHCGWFQLCALNIMQVYCYENMELIKQLKVVVLCLYQEGVLFEEVIIHWYKEGHTSKGWSVYQAQMAPVIKWLETAQEE